MKPKVSIIILTYNHLEETMITLDCFLKQTYENAHIIVVDNASSDRTCNYIKTNYTGITLIENPANYGWAKGNNIGIQYAMSHGAEYVLLANSDLFFDNVAIISQLISDFESFSDEQKIKILGTEQYTYTTPHLLQSDGIFHFSNSTKRNHKINSFRNQNESKLPSNFFKVDAIIGAFILIQCKLFNEIGFIDEDYYFTWEDTDLCFRAWQNGFQCVVDKDLQIFHKAYTTCKKNSALSTYYRMRNLYMFQKKHRKSIGNYYFYLFIYYYKFIRRIGSILFFPSKQSENRKKVLKAALLGFSDALIYHRKGKRY